MRKPSNLLTLVATGILCGTATSSFAQSHQTHQSDVVVAGAADSIPVSALPKTQASGAVVEPNVAPTPQGSAPALSQLFVNNVCTSSAGTGCETISSGQVATAVTYTGSQIYTYVWEIGYGGNMTATQGGTAITGAYVVQKLPVCLNGNSYSVAPNCPTQFTVQGYRYVFNVGYFLSNNYAENFSATDTSINSPYNRLTANLQINYTH